jgi:AAA domain/HNH endonuclease
VLGLKLENIGPFDAAEMEFVSDPEEKAPITLLTGINGTGKSILLDAIRGLFGPEYCWLERAIWRKDTPFRAEMTTEWGGKRETLVTTESALGHTATRTLYSLQNQNNRAGLLGLPLTIQQESVRPSWIVDFWPAVLATDSYEPEILSRNKVQWTARFLERRGQDATRRPESSQYAHDEVVAALRAMSFHKCFYCERRLGEGQHEVDHYVGVAEAPARAFDWPNLYLSCKPCNRKLGSIAAAECVDPCDETLRPEEPAQAQGTERSFRAILGSGCNPKALPPRNARAYREGARGRSPRT